MIKYIILLAALSLAAAIFCIVCPTALILSITIPLAASATFAAFGLYAMAVATAAVAITAAATVWAIGGIFKGIFSLIDYAINRCCRDTLSTDPESPDPQEDAPRPASPSTDLGTNNTTDAPVTPSRSRAGSGAGFFEPAASPTMTLVDDAPALSTPRM